MAFGTTPKDSSLIPLGSVYVPNHAGSNLSALQGGPASTDTNGNESAPVATYTPDGNDVTQGATTDAAVTGDTSGTLSAKLRGLLKIWTDIWDSTNHRIKVDGSGVTQPVSGTVTATNPSVGTDGSGIPTSSTLIGGSDGTNLQALQVDASKYLKVNVAAASSVPVTGTFWQATQPVSAASLPLPSNAAQEAGGNLATIAGAITSNVLQANNKQVNGTPVSVNAGNRDGGTQRFIEAGNGTGTVTQVASSATSGVILAANTNKKGTLFFNDSTQILYLLYGTGTASPTNYSVKIGSQAYFENRCYTGGFNGIWAAANGFVYCTEVS